MQRPEWSALLDCAIRTLCSRAGVCLVHLDERVELRVEATDAIEIKIEKRTRGHRAVAQASR